MQERESRVGGPAARLEILPTITGALGFSLRHILAFFLLGLLVNLPTYLHSFLPRELLQFDPGENWSGRIPFPEALLEGIKLPRATWETDFAIPLVEVMLFGIAAAIIVQTRQGDRRGETWAILSGLTGLMRHWWTVLGVGFLCGLAMGLTQYIATVLPLSGIVLGSLILFAMWILCVVMPCAAVHNMGVIDCFEYSAELSYGSRLRILAIYVLIALVVVGFGTLAFLSLRYGLKVERLATPPISHWFVAALGTAYFGPLLAIIHEALVAFKEGPHPQTRASVFS